MQNRIEAKYLQLSKENYQRLKEQQTERVNSVLDYTENNGVCRQIQLLHYFNERDHHDCGHCDVCLSKKHKDTKKYRRIINEVLRDKQLALDEIKKALSVYNDETWLKEFHEMLEEGTIVVQNGNYSLKQSVNQ
jgi:ATP-dependent DNA helicase RecQ